MVRFFTLGQSFIAEVQNDVVQMLSRVWRAELKLENMLVLMARRRRKFREIFAPKRPRSNLAIEVNF